MTLWQLLFIYSKSFSFAGYCAVITPTQVWHYTDALWPDHIPFRAIWNLQSIWSCFFPPHHVVAPSGSHIQNLFVCSCFSCSLSSLFSLSALHPVMDQRTCPKVLYRQHTCSMSLHADVTLQLQPCTVDMCVSTQMVWSSTGSWCVALQATVCEYFKLHWPWSKR